MSQAGTKYVLFILLVSLMFTLTLTEYKWMKYIVYVFSGMVTVHIAWMFADFVSLYLSPCRRVKAENKAVFITGCTSGFGFHLAKLLCEEGFLVFAGCRKPESPGAKELRATCDENRLHIVNVDVNIDDDVQRAVEEVRKTMPKGTVLWALINNAGYARATTVDFSSMSVVYDHLEVNAVGPYRMTKAFLPLLRQTKGSRVIFMSSIGTRISFPLLAAYTLSKASLVNFTECLRSELKPWNIDVICLEPMLYKTRLADINTNITAMENEWKRAPEEARKEYGEERHLKTLQFSKFALRFALSDIDHVVGAMRDAVTCVGYPMRTIIAPIHWRLLFTLTAYVPREIEDLIIWLLEKIALSSRFQVDSS